MLFFWSFSVLDEKKASPYATEEYLFMPTITAHPRTDCLNRSANNWRISKLFNTFMTQYNIFDPQQLCQGRGGLNCQVWKVIVEHSQSVSQCFTAAQSYWEQSTKSFNPSMPDIFHLETRQKCLLALQTANCSRYSQGNIQMPDIPNKLSLTLWYPEAVRLSNSATSKQLRKCTILTSAVNSGTWLFYSSLHLGLSWRFLQADTNMDTFGVFPLLWIANHSNQSNISMYVFTLFLYFKVENPSMPNDEGITPLHNAVCAGHHHIVKFLLDFGVNVNAADSDGWSVPSFSCYIM